MSSSMEPVAVNSHKHDPAWKHCQMYKVGERVQLKCLYCGKIFKGGGIHRIKEHLAGQKGNASSCLRVQPDVRLQMQESLNGVVVKKRKKQKIKEELSNFKTGTSEVEDFSHCGLNTEAEVSPVPNAMEPSSNLLLCGPEGSGSRGRGRKKKGRFQKALTFANANCASVNANAVVATRRANHQLNMAIGRFLFDVGVPLEAVNSIYFQQMIDTVASQGVGVVAPTYHDLRSWILKSSLQEVKNEINQYMGTWAKTGCSVLVDERMSGKDKTLINFLVHCPEGTVFLRSVDVSDTINSYDTLYELLRDVVEEVGERNVLQVVTSSEERYAIAGKKLTEKFPTVFWTPCAARCIDLMLDDFRKLEWISTILEQARSISQYVYNHGDVLNMMRRYTFGVDLVNLDVTRAATDFLTLKRMVNIKHNLHSMVTSDEWMDSSYSKKPEGYAMLDHISSQSFWSTCSLITRLTDPLLRLLRIVTNEKRPAMGYVFAGIYRAKEAIKKEYGGKKDFLVYWDIIDNRWEPLQRHPLHAAGFYLNPKFFYSSEGDIHLYVRSLVYDCIEKLVPEPKVQDKIVKETTSYHNASGDFGRKMAIRARDTLLAGEWWSTHGGCCPNLARLAIRILSQTCSLIGVQSNHICFNRLHETKNCLEHQRLSDLVFVQYNLRLGQKAQKNKEQEVLDPISYENISVAEDWITEKEILLEDLGSSDWMTVEPPSSNLMFLGPPIDDVEALGAGFDDYEIFDGAKFTERENSENQ